MTMSTTTMAAENADPNQYDGGGGDDDNVSPIKAVVGGAMTNSKPPRGGGTMKKKKERVSFSPTKSPGSRRGRRRSSSAFATTATTTDDVEEEDSDIEFTLDGAVAIGGGSSDEVTPANATSMKSSKKGIAFGGGGGTKKQTQQQQQRRRRRSSARFLAASAMDGGEDGEVGIDGGGSPSGGGGDDDDGNSPGATSSEHLGEIYRRAIRMNAENKINANNSWGFKLIENMDKFIVEESGGINDFNGVTSDGISPKMISQRDEASEALSKVRKMKNKDERGRVNFAKASCAIDASVKIYSYRVDDVHLSSFRVLANLNRSDNTKDDDGGNGMMDSGGMTEDGGDGGAGGCGEKVVKRRTNTRPADTLESNMANINMSRLDSAFDIDPLFHKMSKSFDEGGAKGLLLGNLGVSQRGCRIVFDSKEDEEDEENNNNSDSVGDGVTNEEGNEHVTTTFKNNERDIDVSRLGAKLASTLASCGYRSPASAPFVPQLESLRRDYALLEAEGYGVDERAQEVGRKRLRLYDAPDEEEKEAERSIHVIALERSRGSVLGMSFDTNFRLDMDDDDGNNAGTGADFGADDYGGEGEFAPDTASFGGGGGDNNDDYGSSPRGTFVDPRSYSNTKTLLDALCDGDAFYEGDSGGNADYAFFDMKKFERATDGNLWAGSQHWKKKPVLSATKKDEQGRGKKTVMFDDDGHVEKKERKKAVKKGRAFITFGKTSEVDAIFEKTKTMKSSKKTKKDPYQMPQAEKDFLLPPDANVDISQLTRLFSRPNAIVRKLPTDDNKVHVGKTVGFYDVDDNALGFDDDENDFGGNDDGGFTFAHGGEDDEEPRDDDVDYNIKFDEVRRVEKIDIAYATVAKKVDVRRLKQDLWAELEDKTTWSAPLPTEVNSVDEEKEDDIYEDDGLPKAEPRFVSFKETVEKMEMAQSQHDVTVSFYFICCLHLANEKGLKLDSTGLEDFMISLDDGSAPKFGDFGNGFTETANKLSGANVRSKRDIVKAVSYDEGGEE